MTEKWSRTVLRGGGDGNATFLPDNIRQHSVGAYRAATNTHGKNLGFKTLITPSAEKIKKHLEEIGTIIDNHHGAPQEALISKLNPIIRGWSNYYSTVVSKVVYSKCDHLTYQKLLAWAKCKCVGSNAKEYTNKYWRTIGNNNWAFATHEGIKLIKHSETPIMRHTKVQDSRSPYDGDLVYWSSRIGKHPEVPTRVATLLKRQKGKCAYCGLMFKHGEVMEVDHITPRSQGGKNEYKNFQLLHRHCHDAKTTSDRETYHNEVSTDEYEAKPF